MLSEEKSATAIGTPGGLAVVFRAEFHELQVPFPRVMVNVAEDEARSAQVRARLVSLMTWLVAVPSESKVGEGTGTVAPFQE